ncbi:MAG: PAS domain-containing protein [Alphaproteobacteria bacterium]
MTDVLDTLTEDVLAANRAGIAAFFAAHGEAASTVVWSPDGSDVPEPELRFLLEFWHTHKGPSGLLPRAAIDPLALRPALGVIMLLDVLDGGADFRYRLYGTTIAERTGFDWTGRRLSEMAAKSFTGLFYAAVYRAVIRRVAPVYTVSGSPRHVAATRWSRIILPTGGGDGGVTGFMVGNVPGAWRPPR